MRKKKSHFTLKDDTNRHVISAVADDENFCLENDNTFLIVIQLVSYFTLFFAYVHKLYSNKTATNKKNITGEEKSRASFGHFLLIYFSCTFFCLYLNSYIFFCIKVHYLMKT